MNHFAKVCRKQKTMKLLNTKKRIVNTVDEEPHPEDSVNLLRSPKRYKSDYSSGEDNTVALIENDIAKTDPSICPSKSVTFQVLFSWTPGTSAVFSMGHSGCR